MAPWCGGYITGTNGEDSLNALGDDHEAAGDAGTCCDGRDAPFPYPEGESPPTTVTGSG